MALREELPALAMAANGGAVLAAGGPVPRVDTTLQVVYCPAMRPGPGDAWDPAAEPMWRSVRPEPEAPEALEAMGSSVVANPKTDRGRYGLRGITADGKRMVRRACALLEEERPLLSFWTITLPTDALRQIAAADAWPRFQDRIRKELVRRLQLVGLPSEAVAVAELQPARTMREKMPAPHLHVVFRGRQSRWHRWALDRWQTDGIIAAALASCGIRGIDLRAAGKVEPIRKSVARYMAKYLSKGSDVVGLCLGQTELIPRQWWFITAGLRKEVLALVLPLAWDFMAWVADVRDRLEARGLITFGRFRIPDARAPSVFWFAWPSTAAFAATVADWQEAVWDAEWSRRTHPIHGGSHPREHPFLDQHL